jgi:hypothetical protein
MSYFKDYKFNTNKVTAICADTANGNYLWIAYAASGGNCILQKVSAYNLYQPYYTVSVPVSAINAMAILNGYLYLAVTHSTIFSIAYSLSNPLSVFISMNKPVGITESPIALCVNSTNAYFLTPGVSPGTFAAVVETTNLNVMLQTVILNQSNVYVNSACAITIDGSSNLWITTNTSPSFLFRVWLVALTWHFQETNLI